MGASTIDLKFNLKENFAVETKYQAFYTGGHVQVTHDGDHMFCACGTKVQIVSVETGKVVKTIGTDESSDELTSFVVSNDDKILVTAGRSGLLRQWDWRTGTIMRTWKSIHVGPVACMTFDPTSTLLATGGSDSTIKVWDIIKQYCTHNLRGAQGVFSIVHFHPNISRLQMIGAADDYKIHVWDLNTSRQLAVLEGHCSVVTSLSFTSDGNKMISSGRDKVVLLWDMTSFQSLKTIPVYESVESVILVPEDRRLCQIGVTTDNIFFISAGEKGILQVWNAQSGQLVHKQESCLVASSGANLPEGSLIMQATYNVKLNTISVVTYEHNIVFFRLDDFSLIKQFVGYNDDILDIKFFGAEDTHLAVATNSSNIKVYKLDTFSCQLLKGHMDIVLALDVFPKDPYMMASSSKDNCVRIWKMDSDSGEITCVFSGCGHTHAVGTISCSKLSMKFVVSGSQDTTLKVWNIPTSKHLTNQSNHPETLSALFTEHAHDKDINSVVVAPNDKLIATGSQDKTAKIWNLSGLSLLGVLRGHRRGVWCVVFSPVDQVLATSSADGTIKIWSLTDFTCVMTFEGHDSSVLKVTFLSRGMQLLSSSSDGNVKLWTIKVNECVKTLDEHTDKVWALTASSNEAFIATGGADSNIILWKDVTEQDKEEARKKEESLILQEQKLTNLIQQKKWTKALSLAITLEQPFRALNIVKEILTETRGREDLENVISQMREDQLGVLLRFSVTWNTNSKHCGAAQTVISVILKSYSAEELLEFPEMKENVQSLLPYTERHFQRMNRLFQQATFLDYMWQCMKLGEEKSLSTVATRNGSEDNTNLPEEGFVIDHLKSSVVPELNEDEDDSEETEDEKQIENIKPLSFSKQGSQKEPIKKFSKAKPINGNNFSQKHYSGKKANNLKRKASVKSCQLKAKSQVKKRVNKKSSYSKFKT
ncbi:transducin beta-like protein 3 isoform X2 [Limulus polyphemus]|uniref:Transducin beta-like protein 3 isoform X2 n=1 Tax=Limulus polyphemus TaxID=6850 RepID=A0ABM1SAN3_LIMPO|nr:transducin beta-like protein 3 isoform X2 [Limulus polyphemus]